MWHGLTKFAPEIVSNKGRGSTLETAMELSRDHIFISYAWENVALAEWLARKLLAAGYAVWIDRFKLLGFS